MSTGTGKAWVSQDLIVIGAGIYGIQAARTYLEVHPTARVLVFEADGEIGGVWSGHRVYDAFWTQTPIGMAEFSDLAMQNFPDEDIYHGFFKAKHICRYLERYLESHVYNGSSLAERIFLKLPVRQVWKTGDIWNVEAVLRTGQVFPENTDVYTTHRLVDASGLTSIPRYPDLPNTQNYNGRLMHHKDFSTFEREVLGKSLFFPHFDSKPESKYATPDTIAVIGGAKSAADVAYSCAKAGMGVSWIIRRSGSGPAAFVSAKGSAGYKNSNEFFYTRLTALFLASIFSAQVRVSHFYRWLYATFIGRTIVRKVWQRIHAKMCKDADFSREDGKDNGFYNLRPDTELFWQNDSTGVNQHGDFFDVMASKVKVYRADIADLEDQAVVLNDAENTRVKAGVICCATGWEPSGWKSHRSYFDEATAAKLGLPVEVESLTDAEQIRWQSLEQSAEKDVLRSFPLLDSEWAHQQSAFPGPDEKTHLKPFRLWKGMVPTNDPSIIFVGKVMLGNHFRNAEVQALFACALFDSLDEPKSPAVGVPPQAEMEADVAKTLAWCRRRYLRKGMSSNWFYWDLIP